MTTNANPPAVQTPTLKAHGVRLYRCYNCPPPPGKTPGVDFEGTAENGTCPGCGANHFDPVEGRLVEVLTIVHYEPIHEKAVRFPGLKGMLGRGEIACLPGVKLATVPGVYHRSGELVAVNCPACLASEACRSASRSTLNPAFDVPVLHTGGMDLKLDLPPGTTATNLHPPQGGAVIPADDARELPAPRPPAKK